MTIRVLHVGANPTATADELDRRPNLSVELGASAHEALAALTWDVDCIVIERQIPEEDSLTFLGDIRRSHPGLPIVLVAENEGGRTVIQPIGPGPVTSVRRTDERRIATLASIIENCVYPGADELTAGYEGVAPTQAIVDIVGDGVYTANEEGRFTSVNDTMVAMTGYDREQLIGAHVSIILSEADIAASERRIKALIRGEGESVKTLDITLYTADDEEIACENRFSLLPHVEAFRGTVGVIRDITERKRMEAQLRESRDKIAELHEVVSELVRCETEREIYKTAVTAAEGILEFDICGIDVVEGEYLVPKCNSSGMPGDGYDRMSTDEGVAGKTYRNGESYLVDDVQAEADAQPAQTEYRSILSVPVGEVGVFQAGSRLVGAFGETDVELAELLMSHVSEALARVTSESALRESETKYRTLVEQSRDAVFIYRDDRFVFVNERTCELTGYDRSKLKERSILDLIHPDERDRIREAVERRFDGEALPPYETKIVTGDGSVRQFEINGKRIDYEGAPAVLGSARDITERERRKREIERQNERLKEFTSVVSHDLRNPLNVAQGYLGLARETGKREHFDRIDRSLDRMEQLIEDLLTQARHGGAVTDPESIDLGSLVQSAWDNVETRDAELIVEAQLESIQGDETKVLTLLENLFRNAVEHGGPTVTVTVGPTAAGFFVADDGPGVPQNERSEIFEQGYSASDDGTGLGLAIVERVVEAHDWNVELTEGANGGARFEFEIGQ